MAIILAGYHPNVKLLGISTVVGNSSIENVTSNALATLEASGLHTIPVAKGCMTPLVRGDRNLAPQIHGLSGLDGDDGMPVFPPAKKLKAVEEPAVYYMYQAIKTHFERSDQKVQLVATGPLTNVALLLRTFPQVAAMVHVSIMGGCLSPGNMGNLAEFNIHHDPEAAHVVFQAGSALRLAVVPLDLTHMVQVNPLVLHLLLTHDVQHLDLLQPRASHVLADFSENPAFGPTSIVDRREALTQNYADVVARLLAEQAAAPLTPFLARVKSMLGFFRDSYDEVFGFPFPPLHDPLAVAFAIHPELFDTKEVFVQVEYQSELSRGSTVADVFGIKKKAANCLLVHDVDLQGFWRLMAETLQEADQRSPMN